MVEETLKHIIETENVERGLKLESKFSKEFFITNKMAVEYLRNKSKIEQKLNEVLYWNGINNLKKYIPVSLDDGKNKEYLDTPVYAENIIHAIKALDDMRIDNYMYLEDVDE